MESLGPTCVLLETLGSCVSASFTLKVIVKASKELYPWLIGQDKMFSITNHWGNANETHKKMPSHIFRK